jgi:hypothetical protein
MNKKINNNRKAFLLEWLLTHGREPVYRYKLFGNQGLTDSEITLSFDWAVYKNYINELKINRHITHALTDEGIDFLKQQGELNEQ